MIISFLHTCMFPACCFRQRTFSNLQGVFLGCIAINGYPTRFELKHVGLLVDIYIYIYIYRKKI